MLQGVPLAQQERRGSELAPEIQEVLAPVFDLLHSREWSGLEPLAQLLNHMCRRKAPLHRSRHQMQFGKI